MTRFWTCRKCRTRLPRIKQRCPDCGVVRPERRTAAQKALSEDYAVWAARFGEQCGICGRPASARRRLDRDHDHKTGAPRGLLCARCNRALPSWVTTAWLRNAITYLNRTEKLASDQAGA
jgi:hypothetical protein